MAQSKVVEEVYTRRLKIVEHISLDGVIQMTSGPEDEFPYRDWTAPYRSPAGLQLINEIYGKTCDVLLGRERFGTDEVIAERDCG